jgi:hypothetical protein
MSSRGGLGRIDSPDERDRGYPMAAVVRAPAVALRRRFWWQRGWWGDQGNTPQCVAYSWLHWVADGPATSRSLGRLQGTPAPYIDPRVLYCRAQQLDPWPGDCESPRQLQYSGTSIRAGAKALQEMGFVGNYWWAWHLEPVVQAILTTGPVIVGTPWYEGMSHPVDGVCRPTGSYEGGHAYILNGVNVDQRRLRLKNSWGTGWGRNGGAWVSFDDMERLLADGGEAVLATETRPGGV